MPLVLENLFSLFSIFIYFLSLSKLQSSVVRLTLKENSEIVFFVLIRP